MAGIYHKIALGGTFDHFHLGHQKFLDTAASLAPELVIGITSPALNKSKKLSHLIESETIRTSNVSKYLKKYHPHITAALLSLKDPYGPTLTDASIEAILVTEQTQAGAERINRARLDLGMPPLPVKLAPLINDDTDQPLASSRIRLGLIDRQGNVYSRVFIKHLELTEAQRHQIGQIQGPLIDPQALTPKYLKHFTRIALLGDQVTEKFIQSHLPFDFAVIDYHINRQPYSTDLQTYRPAATFRARNQPGSIDPSAVQAVAGLISHGSGLLIVDGEEDLLGFPLTAFLPLGSLLIYGQPGRGMVGIQITESEKSRLLKLIR